MKKKKKKEPMKVKTFRCTEELEEKILGEYEEFGDGVRDILTQYFEQKEKEKAA